MKERAQGTKDDREGATGCDPATPSSSLLARLPGYTYPALRGPEADYFRLLRIEGQFCTATAIQFRPLSFTPVKAKRGFLGR